MATLKSASRAESRNELLAVLLPADFRLLEVDLTRVGLQVPKQMESPNKRISHVYFIERGIPSVVGNGTGRPMEIGLIGREGMTGLAIIMGNERSPNDTYMQIDGAAQRMRAARLCEAIAQSVTLHHALLRCGYAFHIQTTETSLANGRCTVEKRLAR
jgi:hypothetical protein